MRRAAPAGAVLAAALLVVLPVGAAAEQRLGLRVGEHPGFGRLVFDGAQGAAPAYRIEREGDRLQVRFAAATRLDLGAARRPPRNVAGISGTEQGVAVALRSAEVRVRHFVLGTRVVIDLLDPSRTPEGGQATAGRGSGRGEERLAAETTAALPGQAVAPRPSRDEAAASLATRVSDSAATARPAAMPPAAAEAAGSAPSPRRTLAPSSLQAAASTAPAAAETPAATRPAAGSSDSRVQSRGEPPSSVVRPPAGSPGPEAVPLPGSSAHGGASPFVSASPATLSPARSHGPEASQGPVAVLPPSDALPVRLVFGAPGQPRAVLLPFGEDVGIALLRRGDAVMVVLDAARPLNLAALRGDPVFGATEARTVPGGTVLTLRLAEPAALVARRRDGAWSLTASPDPVPAAPPQLEALADTSGPRLLVRAANPGRIVAVPDPETGLPLLVGTLRIPGMALPQLRRLPEADLLPSLTGLAALARSDRFALRSVAEGFLVTAAGGSALALDPAVASQDAGRSMTRLFDLPALPPGVLTDRLRAEHAAVRAAAPLERARLRRTVAETLFALGLPQEAQAMLAIAQAEDPRAATDPVILALGGAAALLGGRLAEADVLARPDLPERDETLFWRGMHAAARGQTRAAAPMLAATLPLLLGYPEGLRARLLGAVAEALVEAGDTTTLARLVAGAPGRQELAFARAALAEAEGRADEALAGYDAVASGRDRMARARALRRSIELRLASGALTPAQAAEALEAALFAWRGDGWEIAARLRLAELRAAAGDPRSAMAILRETETLFPEQAGAIRPGLQAAFLAAIEQEPPLSAVAMHDAHQDLLPADARGDAAVQALAERLAALDLQDRAATLLRAALVRAAPGSIRRAELGLRLARLHLGEGDARAAEAALAESAADALPSDLARDRIVLAARAEARRGSQGSALDALRGLGAEGAEPLGEILAEAQDWPGAARAMAQHLAASLPPAPAPLDAAQGRAVLRQAALLGLAGDSQALSALAAQYGPRLAGSPFADAFAALTADPMRGLADLPRLQRELRLFRALPGRLEPLRAASLGTR